MSELTQEEIRRRRLARLTARESTSPSSSLSPPITPTSQSPINTNLIQIPPNFDANVNPTDDAKPEPLQENKASDLAKKADVFKEPSKPIDINMPSSSKGRTRAPPQRSDSETSSIHMEVDDISVSADKISANTDIDSGFENMEVDDIDTQKKDLHKKQTTTSTELTLQQLHSSVARVLLSSFKEPSETRLYLPETAKFLQENQNISTRDLASNAIMEILFKIVTEQNPFQNLSQVTSDMCETGSLGSFSASPSNLSPSSASPAMGSYPVAPITLNSRSKTTQDSMTVAINFLMDSYNRVGVEERNNPKKSSVPPMSDVLTELRAQIIQHTTLLAQGCIITSEPRLESPLLHPVLQQSIPRGFPNRIDH
ncbi:unnamed protein product [Diabrotica balteata]|uniref:Uncharacterized protein n=1 Tax=Diabrotica balteata TaxID=107213 RepID=A0A9N9STE2_DIABA|nr:unnamed protein product [Diabrotica balteata]